MGNIGGWRSVARTDVGRVRTLNEDSLVERPAAGLWAVADGMGGHDHGERASGLIRATLEQVEPGGDVDACVAELRTRLAAVHRQLDAAGGARAAGSTVVVMVAIGSRFACAWAGDSRLYRWRGGRLERLTRDHSLVQELVASGTLPPEAAHRHPLANRITRAIGAGRAPELDVITDRLVPGDRYLLASDGLHGVITDTVIAERVAGPDLSAAADGLIAAALAAGGPDNVTVILIDIDPGATGETDPATPQSPA